MSDPSTSIHTTNPTMPLPHELTLIVAATSKMGIGLNGTLPWTGLKKEMAYFARVTKRASPGKQNTVIMGRKTWESIPTRFRPLTDRRNIVISRSHTSDEATVLQDHVKANSLESAIQYLSQNPKLQDTKDTRGEEGRVFVIGGGQIYKAALELREAKRMLLTRVLGEFECDTFFPVILGEDGKGEGWVRREKEELDRWVGEEVVEGVQEEAGTKYVFEMWEREG